MVLVHNYSMKSLIEIKNIAVSIIDLPTIRPHQLSMTTMHQQTMVIVEMHFSDGITGIGEATTIGGLSYGDESPEGIKLAIQTYLAPALKGGDATNINAMRVRLNKVAQGNRLAKSAIETSLLDAQAKRLGVSLATYLGGAVHDTLPVLWTLASGDTQKDIDEARRLIEERRHNIFKLKIGSRHPSVDIAHVSAIKKALGSDIKITVDINQAWSESTCRKGIQALQDAGVDLIEQPTKKENFLALSRLYQKFNIALMADESVSTPHDAFVLSHLGTCDVMALKIGKSGGPKSVLEVAQVALSAGVSLYGGTLLEGSVGTTAALHAFATLPQLEWGTELFGPLLLTDDIVTNRLRYENFGVKIPQGPGLGLEIDQDKLAFYKRG